MDNFDNLKNLNLENESLDLIKKYAYIENYSVGDEIFNPKKRTKWRSKTHRFFASLLALIFVRFGLHLRGVPGRTFRAIFEDGALNFGLIRLLLLRSS